MGEDSFRDEDDLTASIASTSKASSIELSAPHVKPLPTATKGVPAARPPVTSGTSTIAELRAAGLAQSSLRGLSPRSSIEDIDTPRKTALRKESEQSARRGKGKAVRFGPPSSRGEDGAEAQAGQTVVDGSPEPPRVHAVDSIAPP